MTHGDKAKAKNGKSSSQTSAKKVSKAGEVKAGGKEKAGKGDQAASAKQAGREKDVPSSKKGSGSAAKDSPAAASAPDAKLKARVPAADGTGFTNAAVGSAFKHALKKYPNAFRKLTD